MMFTLMFSGRRPSAGVCLQRAWRAARKRRGPHDHEHREDEMAVLDDLRTKTEAWAKDRDGLEKMRTELMNSLDRELIHRALLGLDPKRRAAVLARIPELPRSESAVHRSLEANALRIAVLRRWAGLYYRDRARGDWFDVYRRAAELRAASVLRDLERLAGTAPVATRNNLDAAVRGLNASLRLRLLQAPSGSRIRKPRPGLRARWHKLSRRADAAQS